MKVLLTRPRQDSLRIAGHLDRLGIDSQIWPLMEIVPFGGVVDVPKDTEALLFTSSHAVRISADLTPKRDLPVFCVGKSTADLALSLGFSLASDPAETALAMFDLARNSNFRTFLYLRGRDISTDLGALLNAHGCAVREQSVYAAEAAAEVESGAQTALSSGSIAVISIWSARQGAILASFAKDNPGWFLEKVDLVAISSNAAVDLHKTGFRRILVASRPDAEAMVQEISAAMRQKAE